jgi:uncharacterized protein (DUF983 family)
MSGGSAPEKPKGQPGLFQAALFGICPECGGHTLFAGPARLADQCRVCALDIAALERWGRLAGFVTLLLAAMLIAGAIALDIYVRPPIWVHIALWLPLTIGGVLAVLRLLKTAGVYRSFLLANESK